MAAPRHDRRRTDGVHAALLAAVLAAATVCAALWVLPRLPRLPRHWDNARDVRRHVPALQRLLLTDTSFQLLFLRRVSGRPGPAPGPQPAGGRMALATFATPEYAARYARGLVANALYARRHNCTFILEQQDMLAAANSSLAMHMNKVLVLQVGWSGLSGVRQRPRPWPWPVMSTHTFW